MSYIAILACLIAVVLADLRWLRVAQREHYIAGSVTRFAKRWWTAEAWLAILAVIAVLGIFAAIVVPLDALFTAAIVGAGPLGLSLQGRTSQMVWTARAKRLAAITGFIEAVLLMVAIVLGSAPLAAATAVLVPIIVDLAALIAKPFEARSAEQFVVKAKDRLRQVNPLVVAITGSYGKTGTKQYVAHFITGTKNALASPASFNNKAGLSRTINESLAPGTEVFVAEMGTYGRGEIRELCALCPPRISVITAIGPVHLERFGSELNIISAKAEIFEHAEVAILNVDDQRLDDLVAGLKANQKKVWRCGSTTQDADVRVTADNNDVVVFYRGTEIARASNVDAPLTNVACAVAVALELGVPTGEIAARLSSLPAPKHRQEVTVTPDGLIVIDDTFNANPASVRRGLELLAAKAPGAHRRIVATPGMVELGKRQDDENRLFAKEAAATATHIVVIGRTNRKALVEGATRAGLNTVVVDRLPQAVAWVRQHVGEGDAVLYANDLPDHFP